MEREKKMKNEEDFILNLCFYCSPDTQLTNVIPVSSITCIRTNGYGNGWKNGKVPAYFVISHIFHLYIYVYKKKSIIIVVSYLCEVKVNKRVFFSFFSYCYVDIMFVCHIYVIDIR